MAVTIRKQLHRPGGTPSLIQGPAMPGHPRGSLPGQYALADYCIVVCDDKQKIPSCPAGQNVSYPRKTVSEMNI